MTSSLARGNRRRLWQGALIAAAAFLFTAFGVNLALGESATTQGEPIDPIARASELRKQWGLPSDPGYVATVEARPNANRVWGIALTDEEASGLTKRGETLNAAQISLLPKVTDIPGFGGLYLEYAPVDAVVIIDSGSGGKIAAAVVGASVHVRVVQGKLTYEELVQLKDKVTADIAVWLGAGVPVSTIGINVPANKVEVTVDQLTPAAAQKLQAAYGDGVLVTEGGRPTARACNSRADCPAPIKGGLNWNDPYGTGCTSGFVFRDFNYAGAAYVGTAGHCINVNGLGVAWQHNGISYATATSLTYYSGSSADVGFSALYAVASPGNQLFISTSNISSVTSWSTNTFQTFNTQVCYSGRTSGYQCGFIDQVDVSTLVGGSILVLHQWRVAVYNPQAGDSGAPVVANPGYPTANGFGILSSGAPTPSANKMYYSPLQWIYNVQGKIPCINSACN